MSRAWTPSGPYEPLIEEQAASLVIARARFGDIRTWAYYIVRMSPECFAQQRAYDKERHKVYYEEHTESVSTIKRSLV